MRQTPWLNTQKLYIKDGPVIGYSYQCVDESGKGRWMPQGGGGGGGAQDGFYASDVSGSQIVNNAAAAVGYPGPLGTNCVIGGANTVCSGNLSVVLGSQSTSATATSATVLGSTSGATADFSLVLGPNNTVSAPSSSATGSENIIDSSSSSVNIIGNNISASTNCDAVLLVGAGVDAQSCTSSVVVSTNNTSAPLTADGWSNAVFVGNGYDGETFQVDESVHVGNSQVISGSSTQNVICGNGVELGPDVENSVCFGSASASNAVQCLSSNCVSVTAPYFESSTGVSGVTAVDCDYSVVLGAGSAAAENSVVLGYAQTTSGPGTTTTIAASTSGAVTSADYTTVFATSRGSNLTQYSASSLETTIFAQSLAATPATVTNSTSGTFMTSIFNGLEPLYAIFSDACNVTPSMTDNIVSASSPFFGSPAVMLPSEIGPGRRVIADMTPLEVDFTSPTEPTYTNSLTLPPVGDMTAHWKLLKVGDSWNFTVQNNSTTSVVVGALSPKVICGIIQLSLGVGWTQGDTESLAVMPATLCEWRVVVTNVGPGTEAASLYRVTSISPPALFTFPLPTNFSGTCNASDGSCVQTTGPSGVTNTAMVEGGQWTSNILSASLVTNDLVYMASSVAGKVPYISGFQSP